MTVSSNLDSVAAVVSADRLSEVLAAIHRQGHGHHARVIRGADLHVRGKLERAGIPTAIRDLLTNRPDRNILLVDAPRQTGHLADLLTGLGAIAVERFTAPASTSTLLTFDPSQLTPRARKPSPHEP